MVKILDISDAHFDRAFNLLVATRRDQPASVQDAVRDIIEDVRARGDDALYDLTLRFDRIDLRQTGLQLAPHMMSEAHDALETEVRQALSFAHDRIFSHHKRQFPKNDFYRDQLGAELGYRWTALDTAGLYVPGGTASYPSSLLMNVVPAKVAGVERIVLTVPTPGGQINPALLAAAHIAGVDEAYRIGGAQAVAALAYGTQTIKPVAKIAGPGNAYVAEAKRQIFGTTGIDMIAGPSEVVILADKTAHPEWVAADLLAQAEHDETAQSILITDDHALADAIISAVDARLAVMTRKAIASKSWNDYGAVILVDKLGKDAPALVNELAPEHLELSCDDADEILPLIRNAGAIFVGHYTPEAVGDYVSGSNHVLPTARAARFSSGLGVLDFMKRTSILKLDLESLKTLGPATMILANCEGLEGHRHSVAIRLNGRDRD